MFDDKFKAEAKSIIYSFATWAVGLAVFILFLAYLPDYAEFGSKLIYVAIAISAFVGFDVFVLKELDTIEEIKKNNIAYGLMLVAVAILMHAAISR